jgi:tetratricopeptide (TPR) repeat protein
VRRIATRAAAAGGLALVLFLAGAGIGALRGERPNRSPVITSDLASILLSPGGGGDVDATIAALQARLRAAPDDWRAYASLGLASLQKGRLTADPTWYPKAEEALRQSLDLNEAENFQAMLGMGILALGRHDFAGALEWGRGAQAVNPYSAPALGVIGDALVELGRYRNAARAFQGMVDLHPDTASYARVSYFRELVGDVTGATTAMEQAVRLAAGPEDAAWAGYQLGELHFGTGRLGAAARTYRAAADTAPRSVLPQVGLARVAAARGDLDTAIRLLSPVVDRYPAPEFVILLGDLHAGAREPSLAREQYDLVRAISQLSGNAGVNTDLETALFDADHGLRVADALRRARAEYQRRPSVHAADALAWTLYANGRYREAKRSAADALRLGTRSALFHFHAGMIAFRLGEEAEARSHLQEALSINPYFSFVHSETARWTLGRLS